MHNKNASKREFLQKYGTLRFSERTCRRNIKWNTDTDDDDDDDDDADVDDDAVIEEEEES